MSKLNRTFALIFLAFLQTLQFFTNAPAQTAPSLISIDASSGPIVIVNCKHISSGKRSLSFESSIAGVENLSARVSALNLFDKAGNAVTFKKFTAGEYVADSDFASWNYKIDLALPASASAAAHVSWMTADKALFMLADILPRMEKRKGGYPVQLKLPTGWKYSPLNSKPNSTIIGVNDVGGTVIAAGKNIRFRNVEINGSKIELAIDGEWLFTEIEAAEMSREIFADYAKIFGGSRATDVRISILRFPNKAAPGSWEAETRGNNVTIISSDMPFKSQSEQRLHEQLRHEIFHFWLPNAVDLTGNYDWFYEGFALYQSLKTGVSVNRISFADLLDTLSRAHNIDNLPVPRISLIEASIRRWTGSNTQVYARGMIVAFMCDIALLQASKGKREVADIFHEIYSKHRPPNASADGNDAVLGIFRQNPELSHIVEKYITGAQRIDMQSELLAAGIDAAPENGRTNLKVIEKPSGRQKDLLDKLGYNSWRKLSRKSK